MRLQTLICALTSALLATTGIARAAEETTVTVGGVKEGKRNCICWIAEGEQLGAYEIRVQEWTKLGPGMKTVGEPKFYQMVRQHAPPTKYDLPFLGYRATFELKREGSYYDIQFLTNGEAFATHGFSSATPAVRSKPAE